MQTNCIFRNLNGCGVRCRNKALFFRQYCNRHRGNENYIFEVLDECFPNLPYSIDSHDIYKLFVYIQTNDTYDVDDIHEKTVSNTDSTKRELFRVIIDYLFSKSKLKRVIHVSYYNNSRTSKEQRICKNNIINKFYNISCNTFKISQKNILNIRKIQSIFRRYFYNELTKYSVSNDSNDSNASNVSNDSNASKVSPSENETDPFTFDSIEDIPFNERFGFKDAYGRVYIFNAIEFDHFIETNGLWNPYTRDILPDYIKTRLKLLMIYHGLSKKNKETRWLTPIHAYTEVSQLMEKVGFYNNVTWFSDLTYIKCCKIIRIYRDLCSELVESRAFFPISFELTKDGYVFEFCKEIIHMFENADNNYLVCCNFMKSLALNMDKFYYNLPTWLLDIESTFNIEYESNDDMQSEGNDSHDTLLFFYVYNLLDNLPEET